MTSPSGFNNLRFQDVCAELRRSPKTWLVTGCAGFIGSNLTETLLKLNQKVIGLDNFSTGKQANLEEIDKNLTSSQRLSFRFVEGDIRDLDLLKNLLTQVDVVSHQAALGSVPRSIIDPLATHENNVTGFINLMVAAQHSKCRRVVFASSSSVYGDSPDLPKTEEKIGRPLSPYAASKWFDEIYADVFSRHSHLQTVGLRYFNVFGPRQDPEGAYAAVIPKWVAKILSHEEVEIFGDGKTSRDFCYVANAVQANILAGTVSLFSDQSGFQAFNVACEKQTSLTDLHRLLCQELSNQVQGLSPKAPAHRDFRSGDIAHSLANIALARQVLGYSPTHTLEQGLRECLSWYVKTATPLAA